MLFPVGFALLTQFLTGERPNLELTGSCVKYTVIGWYLILLIMVGGYAVFFALHPQQLASGEAVRAALTPILAQFLFFPGIIAGIVMLSEEYGWRGYLQPKLTRVMGVVPATLVTAIIWAVWHIPLLMKESQLSQVSSQLVPAGGWVGYFLLGYIPLTIAISMLLSFVSLKSRSALPAAFLHACYNGCTMELMGLRAGRPAAAAFSLDHPLYYCVALMAVVGVPMMLHLRRLEKEGALLD